MHGFSERSRKLSGLARKAIMQAMLRSGQPPPPGAQRSIDLPDTGTMSSGERDRSTTLGTTDHQPRRNNFPLVQLATEPTQDLTRTEYPSMPEQAAVRQPIDPQWRANAELVGHQATAQHSFFRLSPNANDPMPATLAHIGEVAPQLEAAGTINYPVNDAQYLTGDQRYGDMNARHADWTDTSFGGQNVIFDSETWYARFSN